MHWGKNSESGWWYDGKEYNYAEGEDRPATRYLRGSIACSYHVRLFVHISNDAVEFGEQKISLNRCGFTDDLDEEKDKTVRRFRSVDGWE